MTTLATAEFFVKPEKADEFMGLLKGALPDTRGFAGAGTIEVHVNQDDPGHVFVLGWWGERSDHERYLAWRAETGMLTALEPFLSGPPKFTYFDARPEV